MRAKAAKGEDLRDTLVFKCSASNRWADTSATSLMVQHADAVVDTATGRTECPHCGIWWIHGNGKMVWGQK